MVASFSPENTFSARILLQASICWSAGVVSVVQSGPSWFRDWAKPGADQSAMASTVSVRIERRMKWSLEWALGIRALRPLIGDEIQCGGSSGLGSETPFLRWA